MNISIIIVSWNVRDYLKGCLESLFGTLKDIDFEVFVVDNNSSDGTVELVRECFPQVRLIANEHNLGFAKANNMAITRGSGKYILLLNPDTVAMPAAITKMVDFLDAHEKYGAVGPKLLLGDLCTVQYGATRNFPCISEHFVKLINGGAWLRQKSDQLLPNSTSHETDAIAGACMMIRRDAIDKVGMLDEEFFMYGEDVDWCYRINKGGWKIYYLAEATIVHFGGKSAIIKYTEGEDMAENYNAYYIYFRKHHGVIYALCFRAMVGIAMTLWNTVWMIQLFLKKKNKDKITNIIARNNRIIKWSVNVDGAKYIGSSSN